MTGGSEGERPMDNDMLEAADHGGDEPTPEEDEAYSDGFDHGLGEGIASAARLRERLAEAEKRAQRAEAEVTALRQASETLSGIGGMKGGQSIRLMVAGLEIEIAGLDPENLEPERAQEIAKNARSDHGQGGDCVRVRRIRNASSDDDAAEDLILAARDLIIANREGPGVDRKGRKAQTAKHVDAELRIVAALERLGRYPANW